MIELLEEHITTRLGGDVDNLDKILDRFGHIETKRSESLLPGGLVL